MRSVSKTTMRKLAGLVLAAAASISPTAPASPLKSWRDGPVNELLTADEYRQFGALVTDEERRGFIDRFWQGIEGLSGGARSSYRETFERRCETANARFETGAKEGWRTDRGRVLLALGEPAAIRREPGDANSIEKEIWSYGASGGGREPALTIVFYRCADGEHRLDRTCAVDRDSTSVAYDIEREEYLERLLDANPQVENERLLGMLAGLLLPMPGGVPLARTHALAAGGIAAPAVAPLPPSAKPSSAHALEDRTYFFRAQDGSVLTLVALEVLARREFEGERTAPPDREDTLGAVTLEETGRGGEDLPDTSPRTITLDAGTTKERGERLVLFGRAYLRAGGTYAMRYAVRDGARDEILVRNAVVGVPDLAGGFSASSIVPAERFGPAEPGSDRFQVGSEEVVPKPGGVFKRSELLRLYLQVYDAALDRVTSKPRVDVVFHFFRTGGGSAKRFGKPFSVRGAAGASMGLALPIGDWPAGPYRVEVELHDRVAEQRTTAAGRFSIAAE
jgi:GWxTD domain-containing protein